MRKVIALLLCLLLIACAKEKDIGSALGETVKVNYIGKLQDGTVFDTNIEEIALQHGLPKGRFEPLTIALGQGMVIPGFEQALIGMNIGDKTTTTIPPEMAYGSIDKGKILKMDSERKSDRNVRLTKIFDIELDKIPPDAEEEFTIGAVSYRILDKGPDKASIEVLVEEGDAVMIPNTFWNSTVVEIGEDYYVVRQDPAHGSIMNSPFGPVRILVEDDVLVMKMELEEGGYIRTAGGTGRVVVANETDVVIDFNHPMAGQTLTFEIEIVG